MGLLSFDRPKTGNQPDRTLIEGLEKHTKNESDIEKNINSDINKYKDLFFFF